MVKKVKKFHKHDLGGRNMLECVCVQGIIQDFEFWERGNPKFGFDVEGVYGI